MKKMLFSFLAAGLLLLTGMNASAAGANDVSVVVNGMKVNFPDAKPFIDAATTRTMVPVRFVSESLGASVDWEPKTQTVVMTMPKNNETTNVLLQIGAKNAIVNGKQIAFDTKAVIKDSRTFVPLRFVSESFGAKVDWDGAKRLVTITTPTETAVVQPSKGGIPVKQPPLPGQVENVALLKKMAASLSVENGIIKGMVPDGMKGSTLIQFDPYNGIDPVAQTKYLSPGTSFELKTTTTKGYIGLECTDEKGQAVGSVGIEYPSMKIIHAE